MRRCSYLNVGLTTSDNVDMLAIALAALWPANYITATASSTSSSSPASSSTGWYPPTWSPRPPLLLSQNTQSTVELQMKVRENFTITEMEWKRINHNQCNGQLTESIITNLPVPYDLCIDNPVFYLPCLYVHLAKCLNSVLNVKVSVGAFNKG